MKKKVVIIGAGPAGLTAAYNLLKKSKKYEVIILEKEMQVGGISKTVLYNGNRMDLGGHRFFSKSSEVNEIWREILPIQGSGSYDDLKLGTKKTYVKGGPNPENEDKVFLIRNRISRIYYNKKFFDYPVNLSINTLKSLGFKETIASGFSYLKSLVHKKKETNLENFYINRFGKKLYTIFFKGYTEKLWGRSPKDIDSSWGKQRVKGVSIKEVLINYLKKIFHIKDKHKETSLIEEYYYPKFGPGQMWQEMANKIILMGGVIKLNCQVVEINNIKNEISDIVYYENDKLKQIKTNYLLSSIPIKDLMNALKDTPKYIKKISDNLPYRDFLTIGLIIDKLKIKNETNIKTLNNIIPDCWIYVQSSDVLLGRIQIFNNWSPYLVKDKNTISLGLEYFCKENDDFWNKNDGELRDIAISELVKMDILEDDVNVLDYHVERVEKAYPAYFDSYNEFDKIKKYLNKFINLYCIGRNGQHRYNNMDHSMECGIIASNNIINNIKDKNLLWNVNTEESYHEEKK